MSVCGRARTFAYRHRPANPAPAEYGAESAKNLGEEARRRQAGRTHHNRCNRFPSAAICTKLASKRSLMFCRSPSTLALDLLIAVAPALWLEGGALSVGKCFGAAIGARK